MIMDTFQKIELILSITTLILLFLMLINKKKT